MGQLTGTTSSAVVGGHTQVAWFEAVNRFARATPWLHTPARLVAEDGIVVLAVLLLVAWWAARRQGDPRRVALALWAPLGALAALGANQWLVATVDEPRPYTVLPHALTLVARGADPSFPSDHAVVAGAVTVGIYLAHRRWGLVAGVYAVLLAASRVYAGAHFPLDVVVGLAVGGFIALVAALAVQPVGVRLVRMLARTPVRPLVTAAAG